METIHEYEIETKGRIEEILSFFSVSMEVCGRKWHRLYITYERGAGYTKEYVYPEFRPVEYTEIIPQSEKLKKAIYNYKVSKEVEEFEMEFITRTPFQGVPESII